MSDRKYRQRGYRDDDRTPAPRRTPSDAPRPAAGAPRGQPPDAPRTPNLMASHDVVRCRQCAHLVAVPIGPADRCTKCQAALHACVQCASFDPSARFQCIETLPAPVSPKDAPNTCALFSPTVRVERQTSSSGPKDARSAFDDLFKGL